MLGNSITGTSSGARPRLLSGVSVAAMTGMLVALGGGSAQAADCLVIVNSSSPGIGTDPVTGAVNAVPNKSTGGSGFGNTEVGCRQSGTVPANQPADGIFNAAAATSAGNATVQVTGVTIFEPEGGAVRNGISATVTGGGIGSITVVDTTIINQKQNGSSLGINLVVDAPNSSTTGSGTLTMSGTNSIIIGQFDPITGQPTTPGNGGGILTNVRGKGDATTTITGQINVLVNTAGIEKINNTGSPSQNDAIETTVRAGTATLDMSNLNPGSSIFVNGGNGLFVDSLCQGAPAACTNPGNGGTVLIKGVSSNLTITVDNSWYGGGWTGDPLGSANAGILASSYGSEGTVAIQSTSATINTFGPLADGIRAIVQGGNVSANPQGVGVYVNNSGNITTNGPTSNGIEAASTNGSFADSRYVNGAVALSPTANAGNVLVVNSGAITVTSTVGDRENAAGNFATKNTDPSNGIYAWSYSAGTGSSGNITVNNLAGGNITAFGKFGDAIMAQSTSVAGFAGSVTVTNDATLETFGDGGSGIFVQKKGGTPQNGVVVTNTGTIVAHGDLAVDSSDPLNPMTVKSNGIDAQTGFGAITISNSGSVTSDKAEAIIAQTRSGSITINNSGSMISGEAEAVVATAANGTDLHITNSGVIFGGTAGIAIGGIVDPQIDNTGTIGALNDLAIDSSALATGPLTINNNVGGIINGYVTLGSDINTMNNAGLWNLRNFNATTGTLGVAVANFGTSGSNVINNTGTIALLGAPGASVNSAGQYLPLAPGSVSNATVNNPLNAMAVNGPVQGQILGVQTFNNFGVIDLTANPAAGDVLVISGGQTAGQDGGGVFVANGGTLRVNTVLNEGGANSQSDMLVVDSTQLGSAPTRVVVNNAGGLGAQTVGDGIAVVEVLNKGASADGVFALNGRVAAGAFEYGLFHNGVEADVADGNWYLRSTGTRAEVPLDTVVPELASRLGLAMLGTYSSRYGDPGNGNFGAAQYCGDDVEIRKSDLYTKARRTKVECNTLLWGRVFGETGAAGGGVGNNGGFGSAGPAYSFNYGGFQAGADLYRSARDSAGLYVGVATAQSDVMSASGGLAGRLGLDAYGLGAYWTHRDPHGWYTDLVLQGNWYDNIRTASVAGVNFHTQGWGITASAEAGYQIALGDSYSLIPQGQIIYQRTSIDGGADQFGRISFGATDEVYGRLGGRFAKGWLTNDGRTVTTWTEANIWHQFGNNAQTTFSTLEGNFPTSFGAGLGGTWAQLGLGLSGQLTRKVSVFGIADYNVALSQPGHSLGGRAGVRVAW